MQIVDDEATPGALTPLVNVPRQSLKQVRNRQGNSLQLLVQPGLWRGKLVPAARSTELGSNASALPGAGRSSETIELAADARRALRRAPGRKGVRVKLLSTFTDSDSNETTITTRFVLAR